ncbi:MAG: hypothetical protein ACXWYO_03190, partial [Gaiellaceae bacterium]
ADAANHGVMARLCRLDALAGREQLCPGSACPFWEPGGAVLPGRCAFERLDFAGRPALVVELLRVREQLDAAASGAEESRARHLYHQLLNESEEE